MQRIAGYVRVSRVAGRGGDSFQSPDAQEESIRAHARARRLEVVEVVRELDESGGTMQRPMLQELVRRVESGELAGIVVHRLDRFARTLVGGVETLEAIQAAGGFVQVVEGPDPSHEMVRNILLSVAQEERRVRAEGFEAAKARAVARGVHISGTVPVGYLRPARGSRLEVDPAKAPAIRDAFELRATGATLAAVARALDESLPGGPSGSGRWNRETVSRLLANRVYVGEARQGNHKHADAHIAIVSAETFASVDALAKNRREPAAVSNRSRSLLAGVCICGSCGYALDRNKVGSRYWVYRCRGRSAAGTCSAPSSAMAPALEELVSAAVLERLAGAAVERVASSVDVSEIHGRIAEARERRSSYEDSRLVAALGIEATLRALELVDGELAELEADLAAAIGESTPTTPELRDAASIWPELSTDERREVIAAMVSSVSVSRGATRGTPLVERVAIRFRGDEAELERKSRGRRKRSEVETGLAAA